MWTKLTTCSAAVDRSATAATVRVKMISNYNLLKHYMNMNHSNREGSYSNKYIHTYVCGKITKYTRISKVSQQLYKIPLGVRTIAPANYANRLSAFLEISNPLS